MFPSFSGGYYNIELAGSKLRLISLNMNLYLEEVAEETKLLHRSKVRDPLRLTWLLSFLLMMQFIESLLS